MMALALAEALEKRLAIELAVARLATARANAAALAAIGRLRHRYGAP
jgi:DNA-binding FadR family transcriptional regulator